MDGISVGRFAPSPTGALHLGNLRTALISWLVARRGGGRWLVRMEDLDRVTASAEHARRQLADLAALGLVSDGEVVVQSERFDRYRAALDRLSELDVLYPCFCTRREIREAARAPHGPVAGYPGTCRRLSDGDIARLRGEGRPEAWRVRAGGAVVEVTDRLLGAIGGPVDDVVVRRNDGVPAYHLAVVVDDAAQGVTEVVRGDDLVHATPAQVALQRLLGVPTPAYVHVPLAVNGAGQRLAKRDGAVTLADLAAIGIPPQRVLAGLAESLGLAAPGEQPAAADLVERFDISRLPTDPWVVGPSVARSWG